MPAEICNLRPTLSTLVYDIGEVEGCPTAPCAAISDQKDALLAIKAGFTNGDTVLSNWDGETEPCTAGWTGITCSSGDVTEIDLCK